MDLKDIWLSNEARARITGIPPPRASPTTPRKPRPASNTGTNKCSHASPESQISAAAGIPAPNTNTAATPLRVSDPFQASTPRPTPVQNRKDTQDTPFLGQDTVGVATGISAPRRNDITEQSPPSRDSPLLQRSPTPPYTPTPKQNLTTRRNPTSHRYLNTQPTPDSAESCARARNLGAVRGNIKGESCSKKDNSSRAKASSGKRGFPQRTRLNPQQSKKRFWERVLGRLYWISLRLRYSTVGNWVALEVADTVTWWSKIGEKRPSVVAHPVLRVGHVLDSIISRIFHAVVLVVNTLCLLLIMVLDSILGIVYRLLTLLPWRPVMVFGTIILTFRIPIALWGFAPAWQSLSSIFVYGTWVLWISNRYVWEPEAWTVRLGMPRSWRVPEFWQSPLFWNLVAIIIIAWAEIVGLTEPFLLSVRERPLRFVPPRQS